nr:TPA_asm: hypothetical protein HUJ06_002398 [Nelumbo nucifera]
METSSSSISTSSESDDFFCLLAQLSNENGNNEVVDDDHNHDNEMNPIAAAAISDEKYAEELQLQEVLVSSVVSSHYSFAGNVESSSCTIVEEKQCTNENENPKQIEGESSASFCEICMETKSHQEMFSGINKCSHSFCSDCISKHVAAKVEENVTKVICPAFNCKEVLEPESCRSIIPNQVFVRWADALCESLIPGPQKFYCPFSNCSALLMDDGGEIIKESECPSCRRLFCAQCKVPWHGNISCEEFQKLNEDERGREDLKVMALAKEKAWQRCPMCKFYVEKSDGCLYMKCRCGFAFCYKCGTPSKDHTYHYCATCNRTF